MLDTPRRLWMAAATCVAAFLVLLAVVYGTEPGAVADEHALQAFRELGRPRLAELADGIANLADPLPFAVIGLVLVATGFVRGYPVVGVSVAVLLVGANVTSQVLKPLLANLDECEAAEGDPTRVVVLQEQFHRLLVEAAANQTLTIFEEMIQGIIELHGRVYVAQHFDEPNATKTAKIGSRAHRRFLDLVIERRHDEATELWERHLVEASDVVLRGADAKTVLDLLN